MKNFPIEKYKFYYAKNKTIAVSTFQGKPVRGVATCDVNDKFDPEKGRLLAAARCNHRIAQKRLKRASNELNNILKEYYKMRTRLKEVDEYYRDSFVAVETARKEVERILETM